MKLVQNGDGTITDTDTGLIWEQGYHGPVEWEEAVEFASALKLGGSSDWKLPTTHEMNTLVDRGLFYPASEFPNMPNKPFWTSEKYGPNNSRIWTVGFCLGGIDITHKNHQCFVRCVRKP